MMIRFQLLHLLYFVVILNLGCANHYEAQFRTLETWKEIQEQNVVMQKFDFSCGTGSLATLMKYYFGDNVTETMLIKDILDSLSETAVADRQEKGLSLFDLKCLSERKGYQAYAVVLKPSALYKIDRPILVYLETDKIKHFAVFRGIREDRVFLADPSQGNIRMSVRKFLKKWNKGIALVLDKKGFEPATNHPLSINTFFRPELTTARNSLFFKP